MEILELKSVIELKIFLQMLNKRSEQADDRISTHENKLIKIM